MGLLGASIAFHARFPNLPLPKGPAAALPTKIRKPGMSDGHGDVADNPALQVIDPAITEEPRMALEAYQVDHRVYARCR